MSDDLVIANAVVVTPRRAFRGAVVVRGGVIADIAEGGTVPKGAVDCGGDHLIPGLVELHTDNLERHLHPRPGVHWPRRAAVAAHDGEFVSAGVTTVLDALRVGSLSDETLGNYAHEAAEATAQLRALGLLKADHYIHLRCELTSPNLIAEFDAMAAEPRVRLVSIMDHTPGQRQFARIEKYIEYYQTKKHLDDAGMQAFMANAYKVQRECGGPNRENLGRRTRGARFAVASHDDATAGHVAENRAMGASIAEFPTTQAAAEVSRAAGMNVLMGAPNLLRGLSHSGNVSARVLAEAGLLDILSSDYAPASLMLAAFKLAGEVEGWDLPRAIACVTRTPAEAVGLTDRGAIEVGRRADLARVYHVERLCVTRSVWREGERVL